MTLSVRCEKAAGDTVTMIYSVSDTGMGIKKESIPHLFSVFRRVDEEKNRYIEGTGLGLSIVKQLVDMMDGIECLHRIRSQVKGKCVDSRIVIFTANVDADNRELYAKEGFDGYLLKPVSGETLENELRRLLPPSLVHIVDGKENAYGKGSSGLKAHRNKAMVIITAESVADIPVEFMEKYHVPVIPYYVVTRSGIFRDGIDVDTRGALERIREGDEVIGSKSPGVEEYESFFARQLDRAYNVIHLSLTGVINSARDADMRMLIVTYVGLSNRELEMIKAIIKNKGSFKSVYFMQSSPAIAVNGGPGSFGLYFFGGRV